MKKDILFQENIMHSINLTKGSVTTDYWPTSFVKLVPMADGTFALGIDVEFLNDKGDNCRETCRIQVDDKNVPYIEVGVDQGFSSETCKTKIDAYDYSNTTGHYHVVEGYPLLSLDDGVTIPEKSVFKFVGKSHEEPTIRDYFSGYYRTAGFSQKGLAVILKYVEDEKNKAILDERVRKPSQKELDSMQSEIHKAVDGFFEGSVREYAVKDMIEAYDLIVRSNGMNPSSLIICDLADYDYLLTKPQGQPQ